MKLYAIMVGTLVLSSGPSAKWEITAETSLGSIHTAIYYGPWQCTARGLSECQSRCSAEGRTSKGCMWLADIKTDAQIRFWGATSAAGGRFAITHCCCDWPIVKSDRKAWEYGRERFRAEWAKEFGPWPNTGGVNWDGHHIRDLMHGGEQLAPGNVMPVPKDVHAVYSQEYPSCYAGGGRWAQPGPERPYVD